VKNKGQPNESYYHQLLAAVLVHPQLKTVLPLMPEAITGQDGERKNDCEVRFVGPKPKRSWLWGMGPQLKRGNA
jgi:hypothetical protein